jgi:hypothetical protein
MLPESNVPEMSGVMFVGIFPLERHFIASK